MTSMSECWNERKLLKDLRSGRREAFESFLDIFESKVYNLARRTVGEQYAEDVAQDALVEICRSVGTFEGRSTLSTWVYRVAMNVCLQHRRKREPDLVSIENLASEPQADCDSDPSETASRNQTAADVDEAVSTLPEIYRDVVVLHEMHGLTYGECAAALGCPVGTVKSRLSEAFRKLRVLLRDYASEGGVAI